MMTALRLTAFCMAPLAKKKQRVAAMRRQEYGTKHDVAERAGHLWESRGNKRNSKCPDIKPWTDDRSYSTGVQAQLIPFQDLNVIANLSLGRVQTGAALLPGFLSCQCPDLVGYPCWPEPFSLPVGAALYGNQVGPERRRYFRKPDDCWDCRSNNLHSKSPDFRHQGTEEALRINSSVTPEWVTGAPERTALSRKGGGCSFYNCNGIDGEYRAGRVVDVLSPESDARSWTRLITHQIRCGQGRFALKTYKEMQENGVAYNSYTFVAALKACRSLDDLESAKQIHAEVVRSRFESDVYVGTMLIDVYVKCGSLVDARRVFEKMPQRDVISWNAMISGYAKLQKGEEALQLYARMQQEKLEPNDRTFVCALKACSSLVAVEIGDETDTLLAKKKCLEQVRAIHFHACRCTSGLDLFVGNMLIDAYAKCGSLVDARQVFETMPHHDVVSWNTMILGYVQIQEGGAALQLYERMQQEGIVPDNRTFVGALKACSCLATSEERDAVQRWCLEQAICIHSQIVKSGSESAVFVGTMLVDVYAKCGILKDARRVFEKIPQRDVVSWNAMILGYSQMEEGEEALLLYARMQQEGVVPDDRTFVGALKACSSLATLEEWHDSEEGRLKKRCLQQVRAIHSQIEERSGSQFGVVVGNMLLDVYARCGSLVDAKSVFETMPKHDVISWNALILGHAQMEEAEEALLLYGRMQQDGVIPDDRTFVCALKACSNLAASEEGNEIEGKQVKERCLKQVRYIHSQAMKSQCVSSVCVGTMLVDAYVKCGNLADARFVFEKLPHRDVVSWTAMILGYAQMQSGEEALYLYARMQDEAVVPDDRTFVAALRACSSLAALEEGIDSDGKGLKKRSLNKVRAIHSDIDKRGSATAMFVGTILLDVYAKCGSLVDARLVFEKMLHHDVVSWNAMISGYTQMDNGEEALQLYARMQQEGVVPDDRTFVATLNACGSVAALGKGKQIHAQISKTGLEVSDSFIASSLIDMYGKCGSMVDAQEVFDALVTRDTVTWNALVVGYARQGECARVFNLFERMKQEGIQPNGITFVNLLTVCSHVGLVEKGQNYFEAMSRDYKLLPTVQHYTCMVDLLGRAGQLDRAVEMVKTMPFKSPGEVWRSLLGSCRKWRNVELGKQAFQCAVRLDKDDAAAYVLMSNIFAAAQMLEEAKEIQAMRIKAQAWKQPGQSWWTDTLGIVHGFVVGDREHPESQDIYTKLGDLLVEMKKRGYSPHLASVLRDIPDAEKEAALCEHSERLAIAYALIKTPQGTTIRVVKNLRVCEDCHSAIALISRIEQRTIICRDASRFHVYKEGKCSCGDYW